jgi:hypothetical protein
VGSFTAAAILRRFGVTSPATQLRLAEAAGARGVAPHLDAYAVGSPRQGRAKTL